MRTVKSGIAVFLVLVLFSLLGWEGTNIAAQIAVFSLREDFDQSLHFGTSRIFWNSIGGFYAIVYVLIFSYFNQSIWVTLILLPI